MSLICLRIGWLEQTLLYPTPLEMGHTFTICDQAVHWNHACLNPFGWGISNALCLLSLFCFLSQASVFTHCLGCLFSGFTEHFPPRLVRLEETGPAPGSESCSFFLEACANGCRDILVLEFLPPSRRRRKEYKSSFNLHSFSGGERRAASAERPACDSATR